MLPPFPSNPYIDIQQGDSCLIFICRGLWTWDYATKIMPLLAFQGPTDIRHITLDLSQLERLDSVGASLIHRLTSRYQQDGTEIFWRDSHRFQDLITLTQIPNSQSLGDSSSSPNALQQVKAWAQERGQRLIEMIGFLGYALFVSVRIGVCPHRFRGVSIVHHIERAGLQALPLIGLLAFVFGVILAFQSSFQLARFGAESLAIKMVAISGLREFGVMTATVLIAGRSGSSFCAELGLMAVNQEIDAMRALSLNPMERLVFPRLIALIIIMPLATAFANIMVLAGGAYHALTMLDLTLAQYIDQAAYSLPIRHYWVGLIKAPVFGAIIALVSCYNGLATKGGAEAIGKSTNRSVVLSLFLTIIADGLFSVFFTLLGI